MRSDDYLRREIVWLIDRARVALGLGIETVQGLTASEIDAVLAAQQIVRLPPPVESFLTYSGGYEDGSLLRSLAPGTGLGIRELVKAKKRALETVRLNGSDLTLDENVIVFNTHPDGTFLFLDTRLDDPPVKWMGEGSPTVRVIFPRLAAWLEMYVLASESDSNDGTTRFAV